MSAISAPTVATVATAPTVATTGPALVWATKGGQQKSAFSPIGAAQAPRAARMSEATGATRAQLDNGQYRPILRDIVASFAGAKLAGLRDHVSRHVTRELDGLSVVVTDWASVKLNKGIMMSIAAWGSAPHAYKESRNVITREKFALTKKQAELFEPLFQWAEAESEALMQKASAALPVAEAALPVAEAALPVAEAALPVAEAEALPVAEAALPVAEAALPVAEAALPVAEAALPVAEAALPVAEAEALPA